jgi:DsbC/DsbD-like thiol-disulfide interchange protein
MVFGRRHSLGAAFFIWASGQGMKLRHQAFHLMMVILALAFAFAIAPRISAAPVEAPHTKIELIAEQSTVIPGKTIRAGVRFELENGWHIYWVNPGDSGEPPQVAWILPAGFRAGVIEWPLPERLQTSSIVDYGYENDVLLMVPLHVPAKLRTGSSVMIAANVNWLVCKDICIPAKAEVTLTLPVAETPANQASEWRNLFSATSRKLPSKIPTDWKATADLEKKNFVLTLETGSRVRGAKFFPLEPEQIKNDAAQNVTPITRGVRLKLVKSDGLLKPIAVLRGVVVLASGRAYEIAAPVKNKN